MERAKIALSLAATSLLMLTAVHALGSAFAFTVTPVSTNDSQSDAFDDYLEPCVGCTPTEEEYENLTTFELLAKYPELSGDPTGNETTTNQTQASDMLEEDMMREP